MTKKSKAAIQDLLSDLAKDIVKIVISFVFSTGLIGGASYVLFNIQPDIDEINRLSLEINKQGAEAKFIHKMTEVYASGFIVNETQQVQIYSIVDQLVEYKFLDQLDPKYVFDTTKILTDNSLQLTKEKGDISGYTIIDAQLKDRQQSLLAWYDNAIELYDETYSLISNWERETISIRDERFHRIFKLMERSIGLHNTIIIQSDQIVYHIENVRMLEIRQLSNELESKQARLNAKKFLSWLGIIIGLSLLISMAVYVRKNYFMPTRKKQKSKAG